MAAKGPECSICLEGYNDQSKCPRILPCGHSFCQICLGRLLHRNSIHCPTCRKPVGVPTGVAGMPRNFALLEIVNETPNEHAGNIGHPLGSYECEACDEKHPSTFCCLDCRENMCKTAAQFILATRQVVIIGLFPLRSWKQTLGWLLYLFSVQNIKINSVFLTKIVAVLFVETVTPLIIADTRV